MKECRDFSARKANIPARQKSKPPLRSMESDSYEINLVSIAPQPDPIREMLIDKMLEALFPDSYA
jgi:hypothetical protein